MSYDQERLTKIEYNGDNLEEINSTPQITKKYDFVYFAVGTAIHESNVQNKKYQSLPYILTRYQNHRILCILYDQFDDIDLFESLITTYDNVDFLVISNNELKYNALTILCDRIFDFLTEKYSLKNWLFCNFIDYRNPNTQEENMRNVFYKYLQKIQTDYTKKGFDIKSNIYVWKYHFTTRFLQRSYSCQYMIYPFADFMGFSISMNQRMELRKLQSMKENSIYIDELDLEIFEEPPELDHIIGSVRIYAQNCFGDLGERFGGKKRRTRHKKRRQIRRTKRYKSFCNDSNGFGYIESPTKRQ